MPEIERRTLSWLLLALAVWLAASATILVAGNGRPYITDNAEVYSDFVHGRNLSRDGLSTTFGLTDETYGRDHDNSIQVYTHQGNFPRIYSWMLYELGMRSPGAQIVATWLTIGIAGFLAMFYTLRLAGGPAFAAVLSLAIGLNYVLYLQWQFDTYRVWHALFVPLSFAIPLVAARRGGFAVYALAFAAAALAAYTETASAIYFLLCFGLTSLYAFRHRMRRALPLIAAAGLGAAAAFGLLICQIILYLGFENFLHDLYSTFLMRNYAKLMDAGAPSLEAFNLQHGIVYWYINKIDGAAFLRPFEFFKIHFSTIFGVIPVDVLLSTALILGATAGRAFFRPRTYNTVGRNAFTSTGGLGRHVPAILANVALISAIAFILVLWNTAFASIDGIPVARKNIPYVMLAGLAAAAIVGFSTYLTRGRFFFRTAKDVPWFGIVSLFAIAGLVVVSILGMQLIGPRTNVELWRIIQVGGRPWVWLHGIAAFFSAFLILLAEQPSPVPTERFHIFKLLAISVAAYLVVFLLLPGYMISAYMYRSSYLPAFIGLAMIGYAFYAAWPAGARAAMTFGRASRLPAKGLTIAILCAAVAPGMGVASYAYSQWVLFRNLPPDHYAFLPMLANAPFKGHSFIVNNYAAPVVSYTDHWAYYDSAFDHYRLELDGTGYRLNRNIQHLWAADRDRNEAYATPDFYICMIPPMPPIAGAAANKNGLGFGCSNSGIAIREAAGSFEGLQPELVASDIVRDSWKIFKLDWDYPPYIPETDGGRIQVEPDASGLRAAKIHYSYAQQNGTPEHDSRLTVYAVGPNGDLLEVVHRQTITSDGVVPLPESLSRFRVSISPASETKIGAEYFSDAYEIETGTGGNFYRKLPFGDVPVAFFNLEAALPGSALVVTWAPVQYADNYRIALLDKSGGIIDESSSREPNALFPDGAKSEVAAVRIRACNGDICAPQERNVRVVTLPKSFR